MKDHEFTYIAKEGNSIWIEGVKKRNPEKWMSAIKDGFSGFVQITTKDGKSKATLYAENWSVVQTIGINS